MSTVEIRKAAVLLGSLSAGEAASILAQLEPRQIEAVAREIASHEEVSDEARRAVIHDLEAVSALPSQVLPHAATAGPAAVVQATLTSNEIREPTPFAFVPHTDSRSLLRALVDEHPQTVALVLSHMSSAECAKILSGLNAELARAVIGRLATIGPTSADVVADVDAGLRRRVSRLARR
jgi:flagellar motor switch protein FliG